ncbi:MAG: prepilin-type N-terminal cleavage/methylation domain-containing protein [Methyloprofundus sp.]|nr:prepilin-type N-terminal cleavage/methylation domain-containing protein [Methyloprofundus sp.]
MNTKTETGFTLLELLLSIAILSLVASLAVPSFNQLIEGNKLKIAVETLKSDLMFARSETMKQNMNLRIDLTKSRDSWCYGINDDNTQCDCGKADSCGLKVVNGQLFQGIKLDAADDTTFDFRRGTAVAMGATLSSANYAARVVVSTSGRIRICSPDQTKKLGGYDDC